VITPCAGSHTERLVHKLVPANEEQRKAIQLVRSLIWWFYADLKATKREPCPRRAAAMRARFDRIFRRRTGLVLLDRLFTRLRRRKHELLRVLTEVVPISRTMLRLGYA